MEVVENQQQTQTQTQSEGMVLKRKVAISRFSNETQYAKGIFYDKENDPVGKQALDILSAKLAASGKFLLFERSDLDSVLEECKRGGQDTSTIGVDYLIFGSITEFGRKNTGKNGVFTTQRTQTVDVGVSLRLVDVSTGLIVYTDEGKGSAEVSRRTALGVGGRMGHDATLSDKALSALEDILYCMRCRGNPYCWWQQPRDSGGHDLRHQDSGQKGQESSNGHNHHSAWQKGGHRKGFVHWGRHSRNGVFVC